MTTIAWDGVSLAGDKKRTMTGVPMPCVKIFRAVDSDTGRELLYGCAGDSGQCEWFRRWCSRECPKPALSDINLLCIDTNRDIWAANESLLWTPISLPWFAIGSGGGIALGAMAAGKTARQAIKIASRLDNATGLGVDVLRFSA